eukprot:CAMPEP_0173120720 /NCGR_PEP_ID=MMETSP1102-20130122/52741_1 /TAXON_ID=49646 /ORGANISM="Geminigera sp., Strain Caron Lab Isolate" /LENGTH=84 /DNA_ID=CAMNT_0014026955 /DNA_START=165 /DNA_END=416 /DNA_ORIENTATION=-
MSLERVTSQGVTSLFYEAASGTKIGTMVWPSRLTYECGANTRDLFNGWYALSSWTRVAADFKRCKMAAIASVFFAPLDLFAPPP